MKINIMENNDFIEGWVATDVDGTHLFVNKPYRAKFGNHFSWVGYQIKDADSLALRAKSEFNIKDNDEPIKVKININAEIAEESVVIATEHFVSNWPAKSKFDYTPIDLDLPSGTLWCDRNVGASKPSDFGLYFQWGDDVAHVNMGGTWHMPTPTQFQELIDNTTSKWTTQDGVNGRLFTSKKNGKSIFIPAAGYTWNGSVGHVGYEADVWSSTLNADDVNYGQDLYFNSDYVSLGNVRRYGGFSVRGVIG